MILVATSYGGTYGEEVRDLWRVSFADYLYRLNLTASAWSGDHYGNCRQGSASHYWLDVRLPSRDMSKWTSVSKYNRLGASVRPSLTV